MSVSLVLAVIGGGQSCEHPVSLASAASVADALSPDHDVIRLTIGEDGVWHEGPDMLGHTPATSLAAALVMLASCDVVLPIVHGPRGEDGTLAALLDLAGVPYVGSGVRAGALAMDKWATKLVARELGIRTAPGSLVTAETASRLTYIDPVVVKPVSAGSSLGVGLVRNAVDLGSAIATALEVDDRVLVEELVIGREVDVAVLQRADGSLFVGPALEIVLTGGALFDATSKYDGSADFRVPASLDDVERKEVADAAVLLFEALGCSGVARFDFFLSPLGPVLNEVNTMPGMTAQSQVPRMFAAAGLPYAALLDELVRGAVSRSRAW